MIRFCTRVTLLVVSLLQCATIVFSGTLDDYYLQQFGETNSTSTSTQLQKAVLLSAASDGVSAKCGMPIKHALARDWNLLETSTQKVLAKQLARPAALNNETIYSQSGGHFKIHYTASGTGAPDIATINQYSGLSLTSTADWAKTVYDTFEYIYSQYSSLGYQPAPTASGTYDIYLNDQASLGYYGVTTADVPASSSKYPYSYTSWTELDSSFTNSIFQAGNGTLGTYTPLQSLRATAAHEYHHAIQYGYNYHFDIWYAEATSTWMEDELYDDVNQNYSYISAWFTQSKLSLDTKTSISTGGGYGRWIFNRYLAEKHTVDMIRTAWERVGTTPSSGSDIVMRPVLDSVLSSTYNSSLSADFFGFAKRVYTRDWISHTSEISRIPTYTPTATYISSPVNSSTTPAPSVTLPAYSFAYYAFFPTKSASYLTVSVAKSSGIQTALFKNGSEVIADANGTFQVSSFGSTDTVVLLIANTSGTDGHNANFSTDGSLMAAPEPGTSSSSSSSSSGGSGCFIATAAYGSYLHPHVQLLRNFRDEYLLTNGPGRAFVALYYHYSPPLADFIARHPVLRVMTRLALTPFVVVVAHPLLSLASLILLIGAAVLLRQRHLRAFHAHSHSLTSSISSRI